MTAEIEFTTSSAKVDEKSFKNCERSTAALTASSVNKNDKENIRNNDKPGCESLSANKTEVCSNCSKDIDPKTQGTFENDVCGHSLCHECRFIQDGDCKPCNKEQQDKSDNTKALDLTKPPNVVKRKTKKYVIPSYIQVLERNPPVYKCSICKKSFHYKLNAKYHEACFTGKRPLSCHICEKTFIKKSHLTYHLLNHSGEKPFECLICSKRFLQKGKLDRHLKVHTGERAFKCSICSKDYIEKHTYEIHMRTHTGDKPFKCEVCKKFFRDSTSLQRHKMKHKGVRNYVCEACGVRFVLKWELTLHRRIHSGYRPYKCDVLLCDWAFVTKKDLLRHKQSHSGLHSYECPICIKAFRRRDNVERHMKCTHPETVAEGRLQQFVSVLKVDDLLNKNGNNSGVNVKKGSELISDKSSINEQNKISKTLGGSKELPLSGDSKIKVGIRSLSIGNSNDTGRLTKIDSVNAESCEMKENDQKGKLEGKNESSPSVIVTSPKDLTEKVRDGEAELEEPRFQAVSVISKARKSLKDDKRTAKSSSSSINNSSKRSESIAPYRVIPPRSQTSHTDLQNRVPTITKVVHFVRTSDKGVPNVQTVITTREDRSKSDKSKQKQQKGQTNKDTPSNSNNVDNTCNKNDQGMTETATQKDQKRSKSVIKYISKSPKKTNKNESINKCFRILNLSSKYFTTSSNLEDGFPFMSNFELLSPPSTSKSDNRDVLSIEHTPLQVPDSGNVFNNMCGELSSSSFMAQNGVGTSSTSHLNTSCASDPNQIQTPDSYYLLDRTYKNRSDNTFCPTTDKVYNHSALPERRYGPYENNAISDNSCLLNDNDFGNEGNCNSRLLREDETLFRGMRKSGVRIDYNERGNLLQRIPANDSSSSGQYQSNSLYSEDQDLAFNDSLRSQQTILERTLVYGCNFNKTKYSGDYSVLDDLLQDNEDGNSIGRPRITDRTFLEQRRYSSLEDSNEAGYCASNEVIDFSTSMIPTLGSDQNYGDINFTSFPEEPSLLRNGHRTAVKNNGLSTLADMACARAGNLVDFPFS